MSGPPVGDIFDLLAFAFVQTGEVENPACPNGDCALGVPRTLPVYDNIGILGLLSGFSGDPGGNNSGSGNRSYRVDLKVLNDCLSSLNIPANIVDFKASTPGGTGHAVGIGTDLFSFKGQNVPIVVTNDAASYNAAQVGALCGLPSALGCTPPQNPYNNFTNNNNTAFGTVSTQVHELGHSLFKITSGSNLIPEPNGEAGKALEDCVKKNHGIQRN